MKRMSGKQFVSILGFMAGIMLWIALMIVLSRIVQERAPEIRSDANDNDSIFMEDKELLKYADNLLAGMKKDNRLLSRKTPGGYYLVINVSANRYRLCNAAGVVREGICSTGNFVTLIAHDSRSWTFRTPRGAFRVKDKVENPVWKKPDWAFIEEGLPVPPPEDQSRFEYGVLGDYALSLGQGYLIHGTLYKRQLGMPVTHGCIRLADEDLELVYKHLSVGSKVLIF
ncbi:MAG: L,D-transpeptidase [Bacteroides sp.]|jgi:hypothetical protein|nr:L,D-transpeptidase [Bacteroides sp.]